LDTNNTYSETVQCVLPAIFIQFANHVTGYQLQANRVTVAERIVPYGVLESPAQTGKRLLNVLGYGISCKKITHIKDPQVHSLSNNWTPSDYVPLYPLFRHDKM